MISDGAVTGYTITYDPLFDTVFVHNKEEKLLESDSMDLSEAKSWCERYYKLEVLTRNKK